MRIPKIISTFVLVILLASCTPTQTETLLPTENVVETIAPTVTSTSIPTEAATNTPAPSPTVTPDYHSMSDEKKLAQSQSFVERANSYSGLVEVIPNVEGGENYPSYWSPTWNSWRSAHNTPDSELDKTGESFPNITEAGYEDEEGYLWHDGERLPKFSFNGQEMSMREMYEMGQPNLASFVVDDIALQAPGFDNPEDASVKIITGMKDQAMFLPGYRIGEQNNFYAYLAAKGGDNELPEAEKAYYELNTNEFLIPIYSKETGEFMMFLNVQQGNPVSTTIFRYSDNGDVSYRTTLFKSPENFGVNGQDQFGILVNSRFAKVAHNIGGGDYLLQDNEGINNVGNNEGIGDISDIEQIINAETDEEKIRLINQFRIFVAYPIIVAPER